MNERQPPMGLTSPTGDAPPASAIPAQPLPAGAVSLEGSWRTTLTEGDSRGLGLMLIRQADDHLTANQGIFPALLLMPGQIELTASVTGSGVTGVWSGFGGEAGAFEWILAPDGCSFSGRWRYGGADGWAGDWTGART